MEDRPNPRLTARLNDALSYNRQRQEARQGLMARMVNRVIRPYTASADELGRRTLAAMVDTDEHLAEIDRRVKSMERSVKSMERNVKVLGAELRETRERDRS